MNILRKIPISRTILRDEPLNLYRGAQGDYNLYSVDFSKSTDPISVTLSRFVLHRIGKVIRAPSDWHKMIDRSVNTTTSVTKKTSAQ